MKLKQLIKSNNWLSIKQIFLSLYPDEFKSIDEYEDVFNQLQSIEPVAGNFAIVLTQRFDDETNEPAFVEVSGKNIDPEKNDETEMSAIEFVPWNEWLSMTVEEQALADFTELEIISHCLYEMTFIGFDEETIQNELNILNAQVEELKNMTEEEKKKNLISWEDFMKELGDKKDNND